jgi:hypothetical protein
VRERVLAIEGGREETRLAPLASLRGQRQGASGVQGDGLADAAIDGPAGAALFNERAGLVETDVADLAFAGSGAVIDAAVRDKAASHAASKGDVEQRRGAAPVSGVRLAERGDVGVVVHGDGQAGEVVEPLPQRGVRPAMDLVRARDTARPPVDRPAESNADRLELACAKDFRHPLGDLRADAVGARLAIDGMAESFLDDAFGRSDDELEFGASDFQADTVGSVHAQMEAGSGPEGHREHGVRRVAAQSGAMRAPREIGKTRARAARAGLSLPGPIRARAIAGLRRRQASGGRSARLRTRSADRGTGTRRW